MSRDASFAPDLHRRRRQRLLDALGDGLLLLSTAPEQRRNGDVLHEFRPGSDFHFLTGFPEPEAVLAAWRTGRGRHRAVLFVRPRDPAREIWDGPRHGVAGARARFGADEAHPIGELWHRVPDLVAAHDRMFHRLGADAAFDRRLLDAFAAIAQKRRRRQPAAHPTLPIPSYARITHVATGRSVVVR